MTHSMQPTKNVYQSALYLYLWLANIENNTKSRKNLQDNLATIMEEHKSEFKNRFGTYSITKWASQLRQLDEPSSDFPPIEAMHFAFSILRKRKFLLIGTHPLFFSNNNRILTV